MNFGIETDDRKRVYCDSCGRIFHSPNASMVMYNQSHLAGALEYIWWMTVCRISCSGHVVIYIDTAKSKLTFHSKSSYFDFGKGTLNA